MTSGDKGKYAKKHHPATKVDEKVLEAVRVYATKGEIPCVRAFEIAQKFSVLPALVGTAADLLEIKISKCQLGLFGYGASKKVLKPSLSVDQDLKNAISEGMVNGRLPCATAFAIAEKIGIPKMEVSSACEKLNIKISSCQLGTF